MQHMFFKEVSVFNTRLIDNITSLISNFFDLKLKILNLDCQESCSGDIFCDKHFMAFLEHQISKGKCTPLFALKFERFILHWWDDLSAFFTLSYLFLFKLFKNAVEGFFFKLGFCPFSFLFRKILQLKDVY